MSGGDRDDWLEVADERLLGGLGSTTGAARPRRRRILEALSAAGRRGQVGTELDPDLRAVLELIGLTPDAYDGLAHELMELVDRGAAGGLDRSAVPHIAQAYVRAVGRIVAVESVTALEVLRSADPNVRAELIGDLIDVLLPVSLRSFDVLHRVLLREALAEASVTVEDESEVERMAIGMVDLVRSTDYLSRSDPAGLEQLVDAIFTAGQRAIAGRPAHIVKYVGDGVFFGSAEVAVVADAAAEMVAQLEAELPLRARGGISYGFVVQRAGDVFGMPVNLAQALTKAARPGSVLLSAEAAGQLPRERRGRIAKRKLPHAALADQRVATLRA